MKFVIYNNLKMKCLYTTEKYLKKMNYNVIFDEYDSLGVSNIDGSVSLDEKSEQ